VAAEPLRLNCRLTPQQISLLRLLVSGKSRKEISAIFEITKSAVKQRCDVLFQIINVKNDIQAAVWAVRHGIGQQQDTEKK